MEFTLRLFPTTPYFLLVGGLGFLVGYLLRRPAVLKVKTERKPICHLSEEEDELTTLFEDVCHENDREGILDVGRNIGREVQYPSGGGYLTQTEYDRGRLQAKNFRRLTKKEEREIIDAFSNIIGKTYGDALTLVQLEKYHLHIIDLNGIPRPPPVVYDATLLCVAIEDSKYDMYEQRLSSSAKVANIIYVGGPPEI